MENENDVHDYPRALRQENCAGTSQYNYLQRRGKFRLATYLFINIFNKPRELWEGKYEEMGKSNAWFPDENLCLIFCGMESARSGGFGFGFQFGFAFRLWFGFRIRKRTRNRTWIRTSTSTRVLAFKRLWLFFMHITHNATYIAWWADADRLQKHRPKGNGRKDAACRIRDKGHTRSSEAKWNKTQQNVTKRIGNIRPVAFSGN